MSTPNLYTNSAPARSYTAVNSGMDSAQQSEGKTLFQQASQSHQPDVLIKRQFEQRNQTQRSKLANEFIASAGREGISQLAATPDGQHGLAVVYDHADSDGRGLMRQMHEEQGSTAVDYTGNRNENPSGESADPLSVSDAGVDIGPRPTPLQYVAMTSGIGYGLAENTVKGLLQIGEVVAKESPELKNVDNLEYAGIDEYQSKSREPGLTLPDWLDVGNALKGHVQTTNEAVKAAKEKGEYFKAGRAMSNDPMLQMTGLGDMAVFGVMARMAKVTNKSWTDKSLFNTFPQQTKISTSGIEEQSIFLSKHVPGLTVEQAVIILEQGFKRNSNVVFGGSRIRGDFVIGSDIDVGFGSLSEKQAQRIIKYVNKATADDSSFLKMEELAIVPGKTTKTIETITTPEQFFQRSGTRAGGDLKAGHGYTASGSITVSPDNNISIIPPGNEK